MNEIGLQLGDVWKHKTEPVYDIVILGTEKRSVFYSDGRTKGRMAVWRLRAYYEYLIPDKDAP